MLNRILPQIGNILIAEPFMLDDNFKRSVVILVAEDEEGHVGYILNQRSNLLVKDLLVEFTDCNFPVYIGGPVSPDTLHFVHSCPDKIFDGDLIRDGIYWGGDFEMLRTQLSLGNISEEEIRFFLGYSGWDKEQLKRELNENSWIVSDRINPAIVFEHSEIDIWKEAIINLGEKYAHIANFPERPEWN
ncbi:protein of unknown function DUF179 [Pseudopedobacter saltans DSM 12145]|uniref:Transcriptional regulator n=1 Tax=Pseudopedobacter saltans (strain ATCC 51119 / DSM 12145 / JCM 21818 / CCUG 39354 / LMG 10337 / NBRC 100064 / NCIMB 13643) TaxID=762903 RepID=F0SEM4_PSESL|nr:YqgE/AlgH family protein [Pseudopedobacter saltans]ADY51914.1 protein of unknown function DUF179 [Pseudopedobacter saltans DSM 12145]